jgi:hypothetical protein
MAFWPGIDEAVVTEPELPRILRISVGEELSSDLGLKEEEGSGREPPPIKFIEEDEEGTEERFMELLLPVLKKELIEIRQERKGKDERTELPDREPIPAEERSLFLWAAFSSFILIF